MYWNEAVVRAPLQQAFPAAVAKATALAISGAPVRTGELRRSITQLLTGPFTATILAASPHAAAVNEGTRPHTIRPIKKRALAGKTLRTPIKKAEHPGTPAQPFMDNAANAYPGFFYAEARKRFLPVKF